jgi:hypothetical protein
LIKSLIEKMELKESFLNWSKGKVTGIPKLVKVAEEVLQETNLTGEAETMYRKRYFNKKLKT